MIIRALPDCAFWSHSCYFVQGKGAPVWEIGSTASLVYEGHKKTVLLTEGQSHPVSEGDTALCSHAFQPIISQFLEATRFPYHASQWFCCTTEQHHMENGTSLVHLWKINRKLVCLRGERKKETKAPSQKPFHRLISETVNSIFSYPLTQELSLGERPDTNDLH